MRSWKAQGISYGPLVDSRLPLRLCIAILMQPHPLACALRAHADWWLSSPIRVGYRLKSHSPVDCRHADGFRTLCFMDPLCTMVNGNGCVVTPKTACSYMCDYAKIWHWKPRIIGRLRQMPPSHEALEGSKHFSWTSHR